MDKTSIKSPFLSKGLKIPRPKVVPFIIVKLSENGTENFITNHDIFPWISAEFQQFSRNNKYVRVPGKLSEILSKVPLFSNPGYKVLKGVKTRGEMCLIF